MSSPLSDCTSPQTSLDTLREVTKKEEADSAAFRAKRNEEIENGQEMRVAADTVQDVLRQAMQLQDRGETPNSSVFDKLPPAIQSWQEAASKMTKYMTLDASDDDLYAALIREDNQRQTRRPAERVWRECCQIAAQILRGQFTVSFADLWKVSEAPAVLDAMQILMGHWPRVEERKAPVEKITALEIPSLATPPGQSSPVVKPAEPPAVEQEREFAELEPVFVASIRGKAMRPLLEAVNGKGRVYIDDVLKAAYGSKDAKKMAALIKAKDRLNARFANGSDNCELEQRGKTLALLVIR